MDKRFDKDIDKRFDKDMDKRYDKDYGRQAKPIAHRFNAANKQRIS